MPQKSTSKGLPVDLKKGGWMVLILAVLVLGVNTVLTQYGNPLPGEVTDLAESVVADSLEQIQEATTAAVGEPDDPLQETIFSTATPLPDFSVPDTSSWSGSGAEFDYYVLALSWEPAFCETEPGKIECVTQVAGRYDATNFVLHGLWPNIENDPYHNFGYCDLSRELVAQDKEGDWCAMPELDLSETVWEDLTDFMPGASSCLHNHEWYKHGICAGMSEDSYYALSNQLVSLFSQTDFNRYVAERVGSGVSRQELLAQFDAEFGPDASDYLSLRCDKVDGTTLLTEIQLVLKKDLSEPYDFSELFPAASVPLNGSCPSQFMIDQVGLGNF
ncbi:MAG: hypothetical protein JW981_04810 [Anaerolineae bacterium]|nr:hypothetical protein [Anaerolineae bacterium]